MNALPKALIPLICLHLIPGLANSQPVLSGMLETDNLVYLRQAIDGRVNARNQVRLLTELRLETESPHGIRGSLEFRYDQADASRTRTFLKEAYIQSQLESLDLRLGRQMIAWGMADGFNPTDNLSAWDYSDPLDYEGERLALNAFRADWYGEMWTLQLVLAPGFEGSLLPDADSRWFPTVPAIPEPPGNPRRMQYAARLVGQVGGADLAVSWFDGLDDLPYVRPVAAGADPATLRLQYQFQSRRALGLELARPAGPFMVRGEAAYFLTDDPDGSDPWVDDPYVHFVVGGDRFFRSEAENSLFLTLEWSQEIAVSGGAPTYRVTDLNHLLRRSVLGRAEFHLGSFKTLALEAAGNLYDGGWLVRPSVKLNPSDGLALHLSADILGGPGDSFFGMFADNDRIQARVSYAF